MYWAYRRDSTKIVLSVESSFFDKLASALLNTDLSSIYASMMKYLTHSVISFGYSRCKRLTK